MSVNMNLMMKLIRKTYNLLVENYSDRFRIIELMFRYYYWLSMRKTMKQYVRNCYQCQRNKIAKHRRNDVLMSSEMFQRRWIDILINFIVNLSDLKERNAICIIINKLIKKRHYSLCTASDDEITVKITTNILMQ